LARPADRLYSLPLEEFTKARNELVRELRKAGKREAADDVAALRKPSVAAWAVNQLARRNPDEVQELLRVAKELRRGQREALAGRSGDRLQAAMRTQRDTIRALVDAAREILEESGRSAESGVLTRISATLRAAAAAEGSAKDLAAGRLTEELEESGFGPLLHGLPATPTRKGKPSPAKRRGDERKARIAELRDRLREAKSALKEKQTALKRAEREAERAQTEAERAAAETAKAEATVAELDRDLKRESSNRS
jgi:Mg2+ and Co2+ transporter CorA